VKGGLAGVPGLDVSRETVARLDELCSLVSHWNKRLNLVGPGTIPQLWTRHVADSAQLWLLAPPSSTSWRDLGSGAGFPGLVIAVLGRELAPALRVDLVESDQRKAAFLATAIRALDLAARVHPARIEGLALAPAEVLSARALAPLSGLIGYATSQRRHDGIALFPKGETVHKELAEAAARWSFEHRLHPSLTDPRSAIVEIGAIHGAR
jgi:16S rRNA (guanine527-N7)-methyltransferase